MSRDRLAPLFTWRTALGLSNLSPSEKLVAYAISLHMNEFGENAFPSRKRLAQMTSLSIRSISRITVGLTEQGWLTVVHRVDNTNIYQPRVPEGGVTHDQGGVSPMTLPPVTGDQGNSSPNSKNHASAEKKPKGDHRALFAALCEYMGRPPQGGEGAQWGRVAKLMAQELVPPAEVLRRGALMKAKWSSIPPSVNALWNNWGQFAEGVEPESPYEAKRRAEQEMHTEAEAIRKEWADADARGSGQGPDGGA